MNAFIISCLRLIHQVHIFPVFRDAVEKSQAGAVFGSDNMFPSLWKTIAQLQEEVCVSWRHREDRGQSDLESYTIACIVI